MLKTATNAMKHEINCPKNVDFNVMSLMVNTTIGQLQGKASKSDPKGAFLQFCCPAKQRGLFVTSRHSIAKRFKTKLHLTQKIPPIFLRERPSKFDQGESGDLTPLCNIVQLRASVN